MRIYGYKDEGLSQGENDPSELAEITLVANPDELKKIASFIQAAAEGMETLGMSWEHEHLSDKYPEFKNSPHFVVFNPEA
ncbi:MAG TPA: hypothetical protein VIR60_11170 [Gammaproteobacteria bacterium]